MSAVPLRGPGFGSYDADEVGWLLTDLSDVRLEADVAVRERAIQAGTAHYAESLPVEYQPDDAYRDLFRQVLDETAETVATAVGVVTELVLDERGHDVVLVSLARAGTPIGILMRRWALRRRGIMLPHFAVSIVRGRGIDEVALDWLVARHRPQSIVFVDGWTGKGAIARELSAALEHLAARGGPRLDPDLAVLADPGHCARTFGTREDFLIPSACLNSTVSGLVSRTVLNRDLIGPGDFHGAKYYRDLAVTDESARLLDTVADHFPSVADDVAARLIDLRASDRTPTWTGWDEVLDLCGRYGIEDPTFVKPGVGETTRVLLRRVPWKVLVRDPEAPALRHIRALARARDVPIETVDDLTYACVGLIQRTP